MENAQPLSTCPTMFTFDVAYLQFASFVRHDIPFPCLRQCNAITLTARRLTANCGAQNALTWSSRKSAPSSLAVCVTHVSIQQYRSPAIYLGRLYLKKDIFGLNKFEQLIWTGIFISRTNVNIIYKCVCVYSHTHILTCVYIYTHTHFNAG